MTFPALQKLSAGSLWRRLRRARRRIRACWPGLSWKEVDQEIEKSAAPSGYEDGKLTLAGKVWAAEGLLDDIDAESYDAARSDDR